MNHLEKIALFENLVSRANGVLNESCTSPNFKAWHHSVERQLIKIYGENSYELRQFQTINFQFKPRVSQDFEILEQNRRKVFNNGMKTAILYLNDYIDELKNQTKDDISNVNVQNFNDLNTQTRKIFISHASKDKELVGELIELIEHIGIKPSQIFCSSFEGYGIALGADFLQTIKNELSQDVLVLFVLTDNFYQSPVCMCEMGAAWVLSKNHIPIVVPPLEYEEIKGVIANIQSLKITDASKLNTLKAQIEELFELKSDANNSRWENRRNKAIQAFERLTTQENTHNVQF